MALHAQRTRMRGALFPVLLLAAMAAVGLHSLFFFVSPAYGSSVVSFTVDGVSSASDPVSSSDG